MPDHPVRQVLEPDRIDCLSFHLVRSHFIEPERQGLDPLNLLVLPGCRQVRKRPIALAFTDIEGLVAARIGVYVDIEG